MQIKYIQPECTVFWPRPRKIVCSSAMSGGYGYNVGDDGEAGGSIGSDDIIDGGSF